MKRWLLSLLLLSGCSGPPDRAVSYVNVETPKPFGYVIGDEIQQRIVFEADADVSLQTAGLPLKGPINRWLELNQVSVKQHGRHYLIDLRYQVFYAPLEVKRLTIPGFNLRLVKDKQTFNQSVPDWSFTIAPLRELRVRKSENGEYMRPDAAPSWLPNTVAVFGLSVSLVVAAMIMAYLAYLYGYFPYPVQRKLFKRVLKKIEGLSKADMEKALKMMHEALNGLYQQPLFHYQLQPFFLRNPPFRQVSSELDWFFSYSDRYFFSSGMIVVQHDLDKLIDLCRQCRNIERGSQ